MLVKKVSKLIFRRFRPLLMRVCKGRKKGTVPFFVAVPFLVVLIFLFFTFETAQALPRGTILYKTSFDGKMYGLNYQEMHFPIFDDEGFYPGEIGLYLGTKNNEPMVLEIRQGRIREIPAQYFINERRGEQFVGAKIPRDFKASQIRNFLEISRAQLGEKYDWSYKEQKGPSDFDWTSVGLAEKIYESLNNSRSLEYTPENYAIDITPYGFDETSTINEVGDCFSQKKEFSKIHRLEDEGIVNAALIKTIKGLANDLLGQSIFDFNDLDVNIFGKKYEDKNYVFFPYTQYIQPV